MAAIVVVLMATATFTAITAAQRSTMETRRSAQAYGVAQQDQARMRTFKISALSNYNSSRTVTVDNTPFTVTSQGEYVTDTTGTQTCTGSASADYISITTTVTWASRGSRPPIVLKSMVSPPNGSIAADRGALAVKAITSRNAPLAGVQVTGTGPASFTDTTDVNGCVLFGNLPAGSYTLTPSSSTALVDKNGDPPKPMTTSVVAQSTNTVTLQYDRPGQVNVGFRTKYTPTGSPAVSTADTLMAFNSGMGIPGKKFGTVGTRVSSISATNLFPFTSPDTFYAGACAGNNPVAAAPNAPAARAVVTVPFNGAPPVSTTIQLPALYLTVKSGTGSSAPGVNVVNGRVVITDRACTGVKRILATNASGALADPGLPYSSYDICVDDSTVSPPPTTPRRQTAANVAVKSTSTGTSLTMYMQGTGSVAGTCP